MNAKCKLCRSSFVWFICFTFSLMLFADKPVLPPLRNNIAGVWFGLDQDRLIFCRLDLTTKGDGFCATVDVDGPAQLYRIDSWSMQNFDLDVRLTPVDPDAEPIYLKGQASEDLLKLEIGGVSAGWKRSLRLSNESQFLAKNKKAADRIARQKD